MQWLNRTHLRLERLIRRRQLDRDLEDELRFHLEMLGADRAGARSQFGNLGALKEACRDMWTFGSTESWLQDLGYGLRTLRKSPGSRQLPSPPWHSASASTPRCSRWSTASSTRTCHSKAATASSISRAML